MKGRWYVNSFILCQMMYHMSRFTIQWKQTELWRRDRAHETMKDRIKTGQVHWRGERPPKMRKPLLLVPFEAKKFNERKQKPFEQDPFDCIRLLSAQFIFETPKTKWIVLIKITKFWISSNAQNLLTNLSKQSNLTKFNEWNCISTRYFLANKVFACIWSFSLAICQQHLSKYLKTYKNNNKIWINIYCNEWISWNEAFFRFVSHGNIEKISKFSKIVVSIDEIHFFSSNSFIFRWKIAFIALRNQLTNEKCFLLRRENDF